MVSKSSERTLASHTRATYCLFNHKVDATTHKISVSTCLLPFFAFREFSATVEFRFRFMVFLRNCYIIAEAYLRCVHGQSDSTYL